MLRISALVCLTVLALAGEARAALPPAQPPDAKALRKLGVRVDWPLTASTRVPTNRLHTFAVRVTSSRRAVKLSLVAVDSRGRDLKRWDVEKLRRGTFEAQAAGRAGERFVLRLEVADQRYWSWITFADDPGFACEHGDAAPPSITVDPAVLRAGQAFAIGFANRGPCALGFAKGTSIAWERATPAGFEPVPLDCWTGDVRTPTGTTTICDSLPELEVVAPKAERTLMRTVPRGLTPGHYRMTIGYSYGDPRVPAVQREVDVAQ